MKPEIIDRIKQAGKAQQPAILYFEKKSKKKPEYFKTYKLVCDLAEGASPHLIKGIFPAKLFENKSPGQADAEFNYSKDNFRQNTLPIGMDYITTISRCFASLDSSINIDDKDLLEYLNYGIREFNSINNWITSNLPLLKTLDPNGLISVMPGFKTYQTEEGEILISSEMNEPQPVYYESYRVIYFKDEEYCIIDITEYQDKVKPKEMRYRVIDQEYYYDAVYNISTREVTWKPYYEHGWGYLPAQKLKGIPRFIDGEIVWQSQFHFVTDILDSILINSSTLQNVIFKCGYPTRVYIGKKCNYTMKSSDGIQMVCEGGRINNLDLGKYVSCPSCNGTGYADRFSELYDYVIQPSSATSEGETKVSVNPFSYISPDTDIVRFLEDHIAKLEEKARKILHIQSSNSEIKGTENMTATGMVIDNKQMFAFIKPISDQLYDTVQFLYDAIAWMRYKKDFNIEVNKPKDFDFKSERDYMATIKMAYESGSPPFIIHTLIERYAVNYYSSSVVAQKATSLILKADRLIGMNNDEVQVYYLKGQIEDWELLIHQSPFNLIDELVSQDENYLDAQDAKEKLIELAKTKAQESISTPSPEERINRIISGQAGKAD